LAGLVEEVGVEEEWIGVEAALPDPAGVTQHDGHTETTGDDSDDLISWEQNAPEHFHHFEQVVPEVEAPEPHESPDGALVIGVEVSADAVAAAAGEIAPGASEREEPVSAGFPVPLYIPPPSRSADETPLVPTPGPDEPLLSQDDIAGSIQTVAQPPNVWMQPPPDVMMRPPAPWPPRTIPPPPPILPIRLDAPPVARQSVLPPAVFVESSPPTPDAVALPIEECIPHAEPESKEPEPEGEPIALDLRAAREVLALPTESGLAEIAADLANQAGMLGCIVRVRHECTSAGEIPATLPSSALDAAAIFLDGFRSEEPDQHITAFRGSYAASYFASGGAVLCAVHRTRTFMPGVRERFAAAAIALSSA
jgi:hypothetical protein